MAVEKPTSASIWSDPPPEHESPPRDAQPVPEELESPLIAYLIFVMRSREGEERLMASYLLTVLFEPAFDPLQKATFQNKAMAKLSKLIKMAYDPVPESANTQHWSPVQPNAAEDYVEQNPILTSCLRPKSNEKIDKAERKPDLSNSEVSQEGYGTNPVGVLIAACTATRALARSVCILRTTLIDNGVVTPIFPLLSHADVEVQIAATAAVCNLVTNVAPMRESFMEFGVLKILCGQAHSLNAKLRLNATWALKHFVCGVGNETKRTCLEELGSGWLAHLICDDTEDESLVKESSYHQGMASRFDDAMDEDVEMDQFETPMGGSSLAQNNSRPSSSSRSKSLHQAELKLAALREAELNPAKKARKDDLAVQEQGLDFIRNLISSAGPGENTEMINYLFASLGQDRVFEIFASKLRT
ncbi:hypothetical protein DID88_009663 [Monilinia fructigena]|uniref:Armadillo repeat-containing protein 8 n=1 Tax=Monilinia fructigena TaxID=38457 RepID=A0A395INE9_9HELO|nr:hypothetical protein DID88_009663 [Monilinia fructigena]